MIKSIKNSLLKIAGFSKGEMAAQRYSYWQE